MSGVPILTAAELASIRREYRGASLLPARMYQDQAVLDWEREHILLHRLADGRAGRGRRRARQLPARRRRGRERHPRPRPGRRDPRVLQRVPPPGHCASRSASAARPSASSARTTPGSTTSTAGSSGPSTPRTSRSSASTRSGCARSTRPRGRGSCSSTSPTAPVIRSRTSWATSSPHMERFEFDRLRVAKRIEYEVGGELEVHRRELQRVLPLPGRPPAAQQADAVRPRWRLRARRRRGRAAGWSSWTAPRRWRSTAATARSTAARRCAGITTEDERPGLLLRPVAARRSCRSTRTTCSSTGSCPATRATRW